MPHPSESSSPLSNASLDPAHRLYVEFVTRISTQRLHYRSGDEETAAKTIYSLFQTSRGLMAERPDAHEFHALTMTLLNGILRPYTARWHGWMAQDGEHLDHHGKPILKFRDEWVRRKFREELRELQPLLHGAGKSLHALSLGKPLDVEWLNPPKDSEAYTTLKQECENTAPKVFLGKPIPLMIRPQVPLHDANEKGIDLSQKIAGQIEHAERLFISNRRKEMGFATTEVENTVGLALSGGGIRSATF